MKTLKKLTSKESFAILREIEAENAQMGLSIPNGEKKKIDNRQKPSEI